jgi:hypothetical protein
VEIVDFDFQAAFGGMPSKLLQCCIVKTTKRPDELWDGFAS